MASFLVQKVAARGQKIRLGWENPFYGSEMLQKASELHTLSSGCATVSKSITADFLLMDSEPENVLLDLENGFPQPRRIF